MCPSQLRCATQQAQSCTISFLLRNNVQRIRYSRKYSIAIERKESSVSDHSAIEWKEATWNAVRGCTKISTGCKHCYVETFAERFREVAGHPYEQGFDLRLVPGKLNEPFKWATPRMVFVNSMSDLFHTRVPDEYIERVTDVMVTANWHTYQVLTKRAERLQTLLESRLNFACDARNIWWGVRVENKKHGLPRVDHLREAPAHIRFLSIEPLLEDLGEINLSGIHWVIVGGESGHGARPMKREWVINRSEEHTSELQSPDHPV